MIFIFISIYNIIAIMTTMSIIMVSIQYHGYCYFQYFVTPPSSPPLSEVSASHALSQSNHVSTAALYAYTRTL